MKTILMAAVLSMTAGAAWAEYRPVTDEGEFLSLINGKQLTNRLYNLALTVTPDGQIAGGAMGWDVTGNWSWQGGFFCRDMQWGDDPIPYNCQLVEIDGDEMRFTTDQGAGDSASFRLR